MNTAEVRTRQRRDIAKKAMLMLLGPVSDRSEMCEMLIANMRMNGLVTEVT